jgi:pilus assembly protein Flp/PilA
LFWRAVKLYSINLPVRKRRGHGFGPDEQEWAMRLMRSFLADETGATAIEYGLIAAGIALAIVTVVNNTGSALLNNKFNSISTSLK